MRRLAGFVAPAVAALLAGCGGDRLGSGAGFTGEWDSGIAWGTVVPGPPVLLRIHRRRGKVEVYEGKFELREEGPARSRETAEFYLSVFCLGVNSQGLDQVSFRRSHTERRREEIYANGKRSVDRSLRDDIVNLGGNFDVVAGLRSYAFDDQGRCAYRADERRFAIPHLIQYDSIHYLFPMLPKREAAPGESWSYELPLAVPTTLVGMSGLAPTGFMGRFTGRLREVAVRGGRRTAVVDYEMFGEFDSNGAEFRSRFPEDFRNRQRLYHKVELKGTCDLDVDAGRIVAKTEAARVTLTSEAVVVEGTRARNAVTTIQAHTRMTLNWLPPGTRLKTGAVVPD
ncbi:MAG: hypothetical protein N3A38_03675 [Planctomycetota bacterium]|nr:hypothetical protein [Planctomycetota bacterium]